MTFPNFERVLAEYNAAHPDAVIGSVTFGPAYKDTEENAKLLLEQIDRIASQHRVYESIPKAFRDKYRVKYYRKSLRELMKTCATSVEDDQDDPLVAFKRKLWGTIDNILMSESQIQSTLQAWEDYQDHADLAQEIRVGDDTF